MNRKDLQTKNPIGAHVFFNIIITVLVLAGLGVAYVGMNMRNRGKVKELKKMETGIQVLEQEIAMLKMDLETAQDDGRLAEQLRKLRENNGVHLRFIESKEVINLPMPTSQSPNPK